MMRMMRGFYYWFPSGTGIGIWEILLFVLIRLLLAAIIVFAVVFIARLIRRESKTQVINDGLNAQPHFSSTFQLLNERLAKGEITVEEYQRLKAEISKQ